MPDNAAPDPCFCNHQTGSHPLGSRGCLYASQATDAELMMMDSAHNPLLAEIWKHDDGLVDAPPTGIPDAARFTIAQICDAVAHLAKNEPTLHSTVEPAVRAAEDNLAAHYQVELELFKQELHSQFVWWQEAKKERDAALRSRDFANTNHINWNRELKEKFDAALERERALVEAGTHALMHIEWYIQQYEKSSPLPADDPLLETRTLLYTAIAASNENLLG